MVLNHWISTFTAAFEKYLLIYLVLPIERHGLIWRMEFVSMTSIEYGVFGFRFRSWSGNNTKLMTKPTMKFIDTYRYWLKAVSKLCYFRAIFYVLDRYVDFVGFCQFLFQNFSRLYSTQTKSRTFNCHEPPITVHRTTYKMFRKDKSHSSTPSTLKYYLRSIRQNYNRWPKHKMVFWLIQSW